MGPTFAGFLIANVFWVPWEALAARADSWMRTPFNNDRTDLESARRRTAETDLDEWRESKKVS
jgi:hypothetical protein